MNSNSNNVNEQGNNNVQSNNTLVNNNVQTSSSIVSNEQISVNTTNLGNSPMQFEQSVPVQSEQSVGFQTMVQAAPTGSESVITPPQQDRVQLINDKPKLHAIVGANGVVSTGEKIEEDNSQPKIIKNITDDSSNSSQKGGFFRTFFLFVLFGGLFTMIIYLPDITNYIETQKYLRNNPVEEKITSGILKCSSENATETLDYKQDLEFSFTDNELTKLVYITKTRGSVGLDDSELDSLKFECDQLVSYADKLSGINVSCELLDGVLTRTQKFDYQVIVVDEAITAYIEAGGSYPDYENMENIDNIERDMNASGYTCERVK